MRCAAASSCPFPQCKNSFVIHCTRRKPSRTRFQPLSGGPAPSLRPPDSNSASLAAREAPISSSKCEQLRRCQIRAEGQEDVDPHQSTSSARQLVCHNFPDNRRVSSASARGRDCLSSQRSVVSCDRLPQTRLPGCWPKVQQSGQKHRALVMVQARTWNSFPWQTISWSVFSSVLRSNPRFWQKRMILLIAASQRFLVGLSHSFEFQQPLQLIVGVAPCVVCLHAGAWECGSTRQLVLEGCRTVWPLGFE